MEVAVKGKAKRRHLSAAECGERGRSAEGTDVLTQPHTVNHGQGNRNRNRGLYPRTPTKRRKCASASGSPAGQQKGINNFFSVTGVISSSPRKSSQPCSSTHANGLNGELFPKEEAKVVEEEGKVDDVSLLAAAMVPESEAEEEEVDDESLLAVPMAPESEAGEEDQVVDYLEGMTAEMFGDNYEFDCCDNDINKKDEEVEPLPDAHYGLLGSYKVLLEPQGCIDDLPEEVLRQVLCQVPAHDLYRSVGRVCHRWRNIVQDPKFVPFKKQYYRYMMKERTTMLEIFHILRINHITNGGSSQHSIRRLVVFMAQHRIGERVRPEDVLERVKKHRLFPQAEASIRLHILDIKKQFNLGIEGPNPYAAMAIILILSETVDDVWALVSLLTSCLSDTAITEYLSRMAMMLLALERNNIKISNRLHYNIYYLLHLMENGPFPVSSGQSGRRQVHLTGEQQHILSHDIQPDHVVKVVAFAGTGKTTTLVKYAELRPHLRFLYVAFNKSVASEAQCRFPSNVDCKTVHSLAFNDVGKSYHARKKLTFNVKPFALNSVLPEGRGGFVKAKVVATTLSTFMGSTDQTISIKHVPSARVTRKGLRDPVREQEKPLFVQDAQTIWRKMKDLSETKQDAYYMTHDGYLKLWQLQDPKPQLSDKYDVLFIDEAQDCTPAIMDVLMSQRCGKILVGDPHQQIYTFKGAVNALNIVDHTHIYYLTQSFRFGAEIAYVGATILQVCKNVEKILVGGKQKGSTCGETVDHVKAAIRTGVSHCRGKTAVLSRCNLSVFSEAVRLTDANPNCRIHFVGGVKGIGLNRILDIWQLKKDSGEANKGSGNGPKYIRDPLIRSFANRNSSAPFWALKRYVEQTDDKELEAKVSIVEKYTSRIPKLVMRLESCYEDDFKNADFIVGTVHKAKGLEFDTVMISDDFAKVPASRHNLEFFPDFSFDSTSDDEWNLLYVAVTRAKTSLIITETIRRILTMAGEYFLKSKMPNSLLKAGEPIPCSVTDCPNCITPSSAFTMCQKELKFTDGVSAGGPLCERCVWARIGPTAFLMTDDVLSMAEIPRRLRPVEFHYQDLQLALF
ncbi:F-box DNA helicase 1 [Symphorus nematophorus]